MPRKLESDLGSSAVRRVEESVNEEEEEYGEEDEVVRRCDEISEESSKEHEDQSMGDTALAGVVERMGKH